MLINSKIAMIEEQIEDRIKRGSTDFEIQLLDEVEKMFKNEGPSLLKVCENCGLLEKMQNGDVRVNAVHAPLCDGGDREIDCMANWKIFEDVFDFAEVLAELQDINVVLCAHSYISEDVLRKTGQQEVFADFVRRMLNGHPKVLLAIENVFAVQNEPHIFFLRPSIYFKANQVCFSNMEYVRMISHKRCGVCIDICHAMVAQGQLGMFRNYYGDEKFNMDVLKEMFKQAADKVFLIHLNNAVLTGENEYHDLPYNLSSMEDRKKLEQIYRYIKLYTRKSVLTIETCEKTPKKAENFSKTLECIEKEWV